MVIDTMSYYRKTVKLTEMKVSNLQESIPCCS